MPYASAQTKQVENSMCVRFSQRIKYGSHDVGSPSSDKPPEGGRSSDGGEAVHQRFQGYQDGRTHSDEADCFKITVFFQLFKSQYEAYDGRQPYESEYSPAPATGMAQYQ